MTALKTEDYQAIARLSSLERLAFNCGNVPGYVEQTGRHFSFGDQAISLISRLKNVESLRLTCDDLSPE